MKVRTGFVSNSSSSSFVIYGAEFSVEEFVELMTPKMSEEDKELADSEFSEYIYGIDGQEGLAIQYDYEMETIYVGVNPFEIKDDETGKQFKERVQKSIETLTGQSVKCGPIEATISN